MSRRVASARRVRTHRARPVIESLEGRQLLSAGGSHGATAQAASPGGVLSAKGQVFRYVTRKGGIATVKIVGVGSLAGPDGQGTFVDSNGALHVIYSGTNVYSKIVGTIKGGGGHAPLASIQNLQLNQASQLDQSDQPNWPQNLSGIGGTPVAAVLMSSFDLVPGGSINLTPGVTNVVLNSIGPNTSVQLRNLPPHPSYRILPANAGNTAGGNSGLFGQLATSSTSATGSFAGGTSSTSSTSSTGSTSAFGNTSNSTTAPGGVPPGGLAPTTTIIGTTVVPIVTGNSSLFSNGSIGASSTLQAGQSASITTAQGVTLTYVSDGGSSQVLTNVSGSFTAQSNILEPLAPGQALTEPPAPPGIILKANSIGGHTRPLTSPLTDSKIFGYDSVTHQVVRFDLNLQIDKTHPTPTGAVDPTFAPIAVPGAPATSDIDLAHDGNRLVLLASSGQTVYAFDPQTGASIGYFTTHVPVGFVASAGNITVLGSLHSTQNPPNPQLNTVDLMEMINLPESLQAHTAVTLNSTIHPFVPQSEVNLLGGLTGLPGSNNLYATVGAHFSSLQPDQFQLGVEAIGTTSVTAKSSGTAVSNQFSVISRTGLLSNGNYTRTDVPANLNNPTAPVPVVTALGAVDQNLALNYWTASSKQNTIDLYSPSSLAPKGTISLSDFHDQLTGLSENYRPDLSGPALIDIQGDVQSIRSATADGMLLNDTGNLATVKIQHINNSTIVGQPISHLDFQSRTKTNVFTSSRLAGNRNGATQVTGIQPIGPMSPDNNG